MDSKRFVFPFCGATWNRTRDTRIFSPLLYQLSYGTPLFWCCKSSYFFETAKKFQFKVNFSAKINVGHLAVCGEFYF